MRGIDDVAAAGVGMVWAPELAAHIDLAVLDLVEIEPQLFWTAAGDATHAVQANEAAFDAIASLAKPTLLHSVGLPVANAVAAPARELERLARDAAHLDPLWVSEHLSFDTAAIDGKPMWTGFLLPPPQSAAAVRVAAARLRALREIVQRPVAFETGVNYFKGGDDLLDDGAFFAAVAAAADCGILLDLHNLWANERNGRARLDDVLDALPLERVWELHVAGGHMHRGVYLDAHVGLAHAELLAIARRVIPRLPALRAIVFEAVPDSVRALAPGAVAAQIAALRELWSTRGTRARGTHPTVTVTADAESHTPDARDLRELSRDEDTLAGALAGACPADERFALVGELVREARGGTMTRALPLTSRLLMGALGTGGFLALLNRYASAVPPERYRAADARRFLDFVATERLDVTYLAEIAAFDRAVLDTIATGEPQLVRFPTDPAPVFTALRERARPPALPADPHAIRVRPNRISIRRATRWSEKARRIATAARALVSSGAAAPRRSTAGASRENASART